MMRHSLLTIAAILATSLTTVSATNFEFPELKKVDIFENVDFGKAKNNDVFRFFSWGEEGFTSSANGGIYWCYFNLKTQDEIHEIASYITEYYIVKGGMYLEGNELNSCALPIARGHYVMYANDTDYSFWDTYGGTKGKTREERFQDLRFLLKRMVELGAGLTTAEYEELLKINKK